jgi:hypothetical protein
MYRRYSLDVTEHLSAPGQDNVLLIVFASPLAYMRKVHVPESLKGLARHKFLRKSHGDFSSYLGARPHAVKVDVFRDVYLDLTGPSRIEDVWAVETAGISVPLKWRLSGPWGRPVAQGAVPQGTNAFSIAVDHPQLWWPRTHGGQPLYALDVTLTQGDRLLDRRRVTLGIRQVTPVLTDPLGGEKRFQFKVNGQPIFLRGANWAPVEGMTHCWQAQRARHLLDLCELGRMNVLRVWGEGHIPPQSFYAECDRRGILIWQDFMFGYNMHPSGIKAFDENCQAEIEGMIRDLRNHPCILLWCGGNENHMGWNFKDGTLPTLGQEIFEQIMPQACAALDPDRLFHRSSPYGGRVPNWPLAGDWHDYSTLKFCPEASVPLYASEVGRGSAMPLSSMEKMLSPEELWPPGHDPAVRVPGQAAWPPMWQYRSVGGSWDKVGALEQYCDPNAAAGAI